MGLNNLQTGGTGGISPGGLRNLTEVSAILDSGLDNLWWGPSISDVSTFPDVEGTLDMSETGTPTLSNINGEQAVSYNGVDEDHRVSASPPTGGNQEYTAVMVVNIQNATDNQRLFSVGRDINNFGGFNLELRASSNIWRWNHSAVGNVSGGSPTTGNKVIVGTYDGSTATFDINGTQIASGSLGSMNDLEPQTTIAQNGADGSYFDGDFGAFGYEASAADAARRDELTELFGDAFNISVST